MSETIIIKKKRNQNMHIKKLVVYIVFILSLPKKVSRNFNLISEIDTAMPFFVQPFKDDKPISVTTWWAVRHLAHGSHLNFRMSVNQHEATVGIGPYESRSGVVTLVRLACSPWKFSSRVLSGGPYEILTAYVQS